MKSKLFVAGRIELLVKNANGKIVKSICRSNLITNVGLSSIARLIYDVTVTDRFEYLAIGTDGTAPNEDDSQLLTESQRQLATGSLETTEVPNDTVRLQSSFVFSSSSVIRELGVFNSYLGGEMLSRVVITDLSLNPGDTLYIVWRLQIKRG